MNELLTVREACERLKVSRSHFYRMVREKQLPVVKLGERMTRVNSADLDQWVRGYKTSVRTDV